MARYIGPTVKLSRRFNQDLGHKQNAQKVARRITVSPGHQGRRKMRRSSEYGQQLTEKQKLKFTYGVLENQLRRYMVEAQRNPQATGTELLRLLERRLDNVIYRLGFAPTRAMARQLVTHGHVRVNEKTVDVPSYRVSVDEVVTLIPKAAEIIGVKAMIANKEYNPPSWMQRKAVAGKIRRLPERADIETTVDEQLIVEFYSR